VVPAAKRWLADGGEANASSRQRDLNRSATSIPSACRIANIALKDAMILPYDANLGRMEFSESTGKFCYATERELFRRNREFCARIREQTLLGGGK
jgi:hypothetical protein